MRPTLLPMVAVLVVSCATASLRPEGAKIQLVTAAPTGCTPLGVVIGSSGGLFGGYVSNETLTESAINDALNKAADHGATHAILASTQLGQSTSQSGTSTGTVTAMTYRCP